MSAERCVLAYSGGLDTSVAIRWLQDHLGYEVVTVTADLGESKDVDAVAQRALQTGAVSAHVLDARRVFVEQFCFPTLSAGALYEGVYPLATALARPLIAKLLVDVAREEGAVAVAHGCTGKGNDQVRFDVAVGALAPELRVVAPVRDWDMGRPQEIEYARRHGIEVPVTSGSPYSVDANLWGRSIEAGVLEDPWMEPPSDVYAWTAAPGDVHAPATVVEIAFERGVPVALDGERLPAETLVARLNTAAGDQGVGRIDHVENRLVGIKSREIYEAPGAVTLHAAHAELESLTLTRDLALFKRTVADEWARLVYDGLWFGSLRTALGAFVDATQEHVTGEVRLRMEHGAVTVVGRRAARSLYRPDLATYDRVEDSFDHSAARGFIELFGLPLRTQTRIQGALEDEVPLRVERRVARRSDA
jgi:argininosuccinate synthase